jgi:hypothetical protein
MKCCPSCGSENWQKLSVIRESGTQSVKTSTAGVGVSGGGFGVGSASTAGVQQSVLAQRAAPPVGGGTAAFFFLVGIGFLLAGYFSSKWYYLGALFAFYLVVKTFGPEVKRHEAAMKTWADSAMCMRCGATFTLSNRVTTEIQPYSAPSRLTVSPTTPTTASASASASASATATATATARPSTANTTTASTPAARIDVASIPAPQFNGVSIPAVKINGVTMPAAKIGGVSIPATSISSVSIPPTGISGVGIPAAKISGVGIPAASAPRASGLDPGGPTPGAKEDRSGAVAAKLRELKNLLQEGLITQEEFDAKRAHLVQML